MIPIKLLPLSWWLTVLAAWTLLLVTPADWFGKASSAKVGEVGLGKLLHVSFYALLAGSAGWLRLPLTTRLALIPLLILHGGLTEWLQTFSPGREGCWRDVGIDAGGVVGGFLITWCFWPTSVATAATTQSKVPH